MQALTGEQLMAWVERTTDGWRKLVAAHPEVLALPCSVRETSNVAELLQHIVAVELRFAERLSGNDVPITEYSAIGLESEVLFATHARALGLLRDQLAKEGVDWEEELEFVLRNGGKMKASRRVIFVHELMHSIRHYAQLATLVREAGVTPGWGMDYLLMGGVTL